MPAQLYNHMGIYYSRQPRKAPRSGKEAEPRRVAEKVGVRVNMIALFGGLPGTAQFAKWPAKPSVPAQSTDGLENVNSVLILIVKD